MKNYTAIIFDSQKNEIMNFPISEKSISEAKRKMKIMQANTKMNDFHSFKIIK